MREPSGYAKWLRDNTLDYRGYQIGPGGISKDGECLVFTFHPLETPKEVRWHDGKKIVDKRIAKEAEDD